MARLKRPLPVVPVIAGIAAGIGTVATAGSNSGSQQVETGYEDNYQGALSGVNQEVPAGGTDLVDETGVTENDTTSSNPLLSSNWEIFQGATALAPLSSAELAYAYQTGGSFGEQVLVPGMGPNSFYLLDSSKWRVWLSDTYDTPEKQLQLKARLFNAGYLRDPNALKRDGFDALTLDAAVLAFGDLSSRNYDIARSGGRSLLNLESYLNTAQGQRQATTTTTTFLPSSAQSEGALIDYYKEYVGRAPSRRETEAFVNAVSAAASRTPTTATTTPGFVSEAGEIQEKSEVVKRGFSESDIALMARTEAMEDPESGPYRMASKYFDSFLGIIGTPQGTQTPTDIGQLLT